MHHMIFYDVSLAILCEKCYNDKKFCDRAESVKMPERFTGAGWPQDYH